MIFISYRQASASAYAGRLYDRLKRHFGGQVFRDTEEIKPGDDWVETLERAVASSQVLVALIGAGWTEEQDRRGRRRLENENDWMRVEIAAALEREIPVFSVLLPGAATLTAEQLPDDLEALARSPSHSLSSTGWEDDVESLIQRLERVGVARDVAPIDALSAPRLEVRHTLSGHSGGASDVAFAPSGFLIASSGGFSLRGMVASRPYDEAVRRDSSVRLWRTADGAPLAVLERDAGPSYAVAFSRDGATVAAGYGDGAIVLWDCAGGTARAAIEAHQQGTAHVAFSPHGELLASGGHDGMTRLWAATDGAALGEVSTEPAASPSLAFSPDGTSLVAATKHGAEVIDVATVQRVARLRCWGDRRRRTSPVLTVAWAPEGDCVAGADESGTVSLWRAGSGEVAGALAPREPSPELDRVMCLSFTPGSELLAVGHLSGFICFWQVAERRMVARLRGARDSVSAVDFSPDGSMLAASSRDATVRVWSA